MESQVRAAEAPVLSPEFFVCSQKKEYAPRCATYHCDMPQWRPWTASIPSTPLGLHTWGEGFSENRGTLLGGPFKGTLFHLGDKRGAPISHLRPVTQRVMMRGVRLSCRKGQATADTLVPRVHDFENV